MTLLVMLLGWVDAARPSQAAGQAEPRAIVALPAEIQLPSSRSRQQLLVTGLFEQEAMADLTTVARYESRDPHIARIDDQGVVYPVAPGTTEIVVRIEGLTTQVAVIVGDLTQPAPIDFRTEAVAALSRAGCSQGACHGSPQGKGGFRLSLRGFDPELDLLTLVRESGGRRTNRFEPATSLILRKGSGATPHRGGIRFRADEPAYQALHQWIAEGCLDAGGERQLTQLEILPHDRRLHRDYPRQRLVAMAHFQDGTVCDVTPLAVFSTTNDTVELSPQGEVQFRSTGEATILVRYLEQVKSVRLSYVQDDPRYVFRGPDAANHVDELIFARQRVMQLQPAPVADDATFLRRVYLDLIGALPTVDESRAFLASHNANKRAQLIDQLLERQEYAQFWALKWADVMRGSRETISKRGVYSFHRYLVRNFAEDRSFAEVTREIITAAGNTLYHPEANFYRVAQTPEDAAESMAQLFMGLRVNCARCHNHPFEALTQQDYYGFAAYFARVKTKGKQFMLDDAVIYLARNGEVQHPLTRKNVEPTALGTPAGEQTADDDRRRHLAAWLTHSENRYFAASTVNRIWYHLLGSGIVDPVDDFRDTNPPSHPELLQRLADEFVASGYRFKPVIRSILNSRTYQLSAERPAQQSPQAARPERYFVNAKIRMLTAEQVLDAISTATGVAEPFAGYPLGTRAIELAEGAVEHPFLTAFSKPIRDVQCDCAREEEPSLNQVIHLLNNASVIDKTQSATSHLAHWLSEELSTTEIVHRIYLATLTRTATKREQQLAEAHIAQLGNRTAALQDLQHALLNSNEFLLRH